MGVTLTLAWTLAGLAWVAAGVTASIQTGDAFDPGWAVAAMLCFVLAHLNGVRR